MAHPGNFKHPTLEPAAPAMEHRPIIRSLLRFFLAATCTALCLVAAVRADDKPIGALLVAGGCCHDYLKKTFSRKESRLGRMSSG